MRPKVKLIFITGGIIIVCLLILAIYNLGLESLIKEPSSAGSPKTEFNQGILSSFKEIPTILSGSWSLTGKVVEIFSTLDFLKKNLFKILFSEKDSHLLDLVNDFKNKVNNAQNLLTEIRDKTKIMPVQNIPLHDYSNFDELGAFLSSLDNFLVRSSLLLAKPRSYFLLLFESSSELAVLTIENSKIANIEIEGIRDFTKIPVVDKAIKINNLIETLEGSRFFKDRLITFEGGLLFKTEAIESLRLATKETGQWDYKRLINQLPNLDAQQTSDLYKNMEVYFKDPELENFINSSQS